MASPITQVYIAEVLALNTVTDHHETVNTFAINVELYTIADHDFLGACIDSGAQRSVIGMSNAEVYNKMTGKIHINKFLDEGIMFRLGVKRYDGLEKMKILILITETNFVDI